MKTSKTTTYLVLLALAIAAILTWLINSSQTQKSGDAVADNAEEPPNATLNPGPEEPEQKPRTHRTDELNVPDSIKLVEVADVPHAWTKASSRSRNKTFPNSEGRNITLDLGDDSAIFGVYPNSSNKRYLVCHGSPKIWSIFNQDGEFIRDLPSVAQIEPSMKDVVSIRWRWWQESTLIAELEQYEPSDPSIPQYPEKDGVPLDVRIYQYDLDQKKVKALEVPKPNATGVFRLEGISDTGILIVSHIARNGDYWGGRDRSDLHAYDVAGAQRE